MDPDAAKKRQSIKVIFSEILMVLTIIATVIILALVVSGYWLNSDFKVERQGMLQISSAPTGADITIDGESGWLQVTNTSKVLTSGEHTILLTKEGYDSWTKTINISEGLLYRVRYPRLYLLEREKTKIADTIGTTKVFTNGKQNQLFLYSGDLTTLDTEQYALPPTSQDSEPIAGWQVLNLDSEKPEIKSVTRDLLYELFKKPKKPTEEDPLKAFNPDLKVSETAETIFSKFYDDSYLTVVEGPTVTMYKKDVEEPVLTTELTFAPSGFHTGDDGEFIVFSAGQTIATLDMETMQIKEWAVDGETFGWLDGSTIYSVKEGELFVYDFDGLNRRSLSSGVSSRFPVYLTRDRWLYYFSDDTLMREQIAN